MQSADGSVIIPSFHRPAAIRYRPQRYGGNGDQRLERHADREHRCRPGPTRPRGSSARARPTATTRPPSPTLSRPQRQDHLRRGQRRRRRDRLGLGRPGLSGPPQRAGPALQAPLRVHGHRPQRPDPAQHGRQPGGGDVAPVRRPTPRTWATRSARSTRPTGSRTGFNSAPSTPVGAFTTPVFGPPYTAIRTNGQVDNGGIDVRLTQLRNLLAGTRPQPNPECPAHPGVSPTRPARPTATTTSSWIDGADPTSCPTASPTSATWTCYGATPSDRWCCPPHARPWRAGGARRSRCPATQDCQPQRTAAARQPGGHATYNNPIRAGYSEDISDLRRSAPPATRPTTT